MPSSPHYKRDYKQEAKTAKKRGEQGTGSDSGNAKRKRARRLMEKKGKVKKGDGKDVHHKKEIKRGGGNSASNLAVTSKSKNRSFPRNKKAGLRQL